MGEGAALFVLKRLEDAERDGDRVLAVLRGIGASSDGKGKGITAPNPLGQKLAVERAWENAGLPPATASLVEGHGTSTRVGDVVEVGSLMEAFGKDVPSRSIPLGSVKSNLGHLKGAAGAAGLLKTVFALQREDPAPEPELRRPEPQHRLRALAVLRQHRAQGVAGSRVRRAPRRAQRLRVRGDELPRRARGARPRPAAPRGQGPLVRERARYGERGGCFGRGAQGPARRRPPPGGFVRGRAALARARGEGGGGGGARAALAPRPIFATCARRNGWPSPTRAPPISPRRRTRRARRWRAGTPPPSGARSAPRESSAGADRPPRWPSCTRDRARST